jgi:ABC-2 type transport system ATP-binding protein
MGNTIQVNSLTKNFKVHKKESGLKASFKSLYKRKYVNTPAVKDISFSIEQGELVGFIGPNGAGKTTTLKMLSGLIYPSSGELKVLGHTPVERENKYLKQISLVMGQKNQLFWDLPPIDTFKLNKEIYEVTDSDYKKTLEELIEMLDIKNNLQQQVRKLSLGQRMKCELAASLIHKPKIVFLDEPTIGLDVVVQKRLRQFIKEYNQKHQATIILTSHYMEDIKSLCKRVIIINNGQIGYDGDLDTLVKTYAKNKIVKLVFLNKVKKQNLEKYGKIVEYDPLKTVFEVPRNQVKEVTSNILKNLPVDDLDIDETPIVEIIRQVFEKS